MQVNCLICDRNLIIDENELVQDGGFVYIEFHYGSRHDQCKGFKNISDNKLLNSDQIEAYICDDCFEKKQEKMRGFKIERINKREEIK